MSDTDEAAESSDGVDPEGDSLAGLLGIVDYEHPSAGLARGALPVTPRVCQPYGIVHGGAYAALAETITSRATWEVVRPELAAFGQTNETSFLRAVASGTIRAEARARHQGRTSWVWDVEMSDDEGRVCALTRMTIAVRPLRPRGSDT